jgi:hypothetical protein
MFSAFCIPIKVARFGLPITGSWIGQGIGVTLVTRPMKLEVHDLRAPGQGGVVLPATDRY